MDAYPVDAAQRSAAKVVGLAYLIGFAIVVVGNFGVLGGLFVPHDAAATARNVLAHETQFRLGVICDLLYVVSMLFLIPALYVVLRPAGQMLALAAAICRLLFAVCWSVTTLNMLGALRLFTGADYLQAVPTDLLYALGRAQLRGGFDDYYVGLPFFALAATLCAWLWLKSRYVPRGLALFGVVAGAWGVFCAFAFLLFPGFNEIVNDWFFDLPFSLFELAVGAWLLAKGLPKEAAAA